VKTQVRTIKGESKRKGGLQLAFGLSYIAVPSSLLQEMLTMWAGGGPVHKAKGEGGGVIGGGVVDINVGINVEHDYQAGAPEMLLARVEVVGQGSARERP
jgi:hypothetical protein